MVVAEIKIIKPGTLALDWFEPASSPIFAMKYLCGIGGGSTVTFLRSDATILVDTGFDKESDMSADNIRSNQKRLIHALKEAGLASKDIDILFITHWHADHFMNQRIFDDSEVIMLKDAVERHHLDCRGIGPGQKIAAGVVVIPTPGHTVDHASLLVKTENLRYTCRTIGGGRIMGIGSVNVVVAGDAVVSPSCYTSGTIWHYNPDFYSEEEALASVKKIREIADFIIPGHGGMFWNDKGQARART
ncbi:MAG: MBL fold metallo-hydrolase [Methanolinea sp.]|nr:MBL fold metallo-hydrolase [Methanolinea sp.]